MRPDLRSPDIQLVVKALAVMGGTISGAALGFAFWVVAARLLPPAAVGSASAAIAAAGLTAMLAECGIGTLLVERLPRAAGRSALIASGLAVAGLAAVLAAGAVSVAAIAAAAFGLAAPHWSLAGALLVPGVALATALGSVCDQACYGLLRTDLAFERSLVASGGKLVLLPVLALGAGVGGEAAVASSWLLAGLASLGWIAWRVGARPSPRSWRGGAGLDRRALGRLAGHHALNVAASAVGLAMPLLASICLGPAATAPVYVAWLVTTTAFLAPAALTGVLLAVGNIDPATRAERLRFSLKAGLAVALGTSLALPCVGPLILPLFGPRYEAAVADLAILGVAALPSAIRHHFIAVRRFAGTMASAAGLFAAGAVLELVSAGVGARLGAGPGLCIGWALATWAQGIIMAPAVFAAARRPAGRHGAPEAPSESAPFSA